jgi:hypothetical protein
MDVRNFTTPPLNYDDVSTAEILLKIEIVETYVKRKYFEGGSIPTDGRVAILALIVSNLLARTDLARKYGSLNAERLGDYEYEIAGASTRGKDVITNPLEVIKSWQRMALELLHDLSASNKYQVRLSNQ